MSAVGQVEAAAALVRWLRESGIASWNLLAYPDGSPYLRLPIESPFEALLVPEEGRWFLVRIREAKLPPRFEPLVGIAASAEAVIDAAIRGLVQFATDERDAGELEASDAYARAAKGLGDAMGHGS